MMKSRRTLGTIVLMVAALLPALGLNVDSAPPLYKQCDEKWGNDLMGVPGALKRAKVCAQGCAMSSIAMALAGRGIRLPSGKIPTPGTLNAYLVANNGYRILQGNPNNLVLDAPNSASGGLVRLVGEWGGKCCGEQDALPPKSKLIEWVMASGTGSMIVIPHVRSGSHFVLATGYDPSTDSFTVNDPGFNETSYAFEEMSDVLIYSAFPVDTASIPRPYPLFEQFDYVCFVFLSFHNTILTSCFLLSTALEKRSHCDRNGGRSWLFDELNVNGTARAQHYYRWQGCESGIVEFMAQIQSWIHRWERFHRVGAESPLSARCLAQRQHARKERFDDRRRAKTFTSRPASHCQCDERKAFCACSWLGQFSQWDALRRGPGFLLDVVRLERRRRVALISHDAVTNKHTPRFHCTNLYKVIVTYYMLLHMKSVRNKQ